MPSVVIISIQWYGSVAVLIYCQKLIVLWSPEGFNQPQQPNKALFFYLNFIMAFSLRKYASLMINKKSNVFIKIGYPIMVRMRLYWWGKVKYIATYYID